MGTKMTKAEGKAAERWSETQTLLEECGLVGRLFVQGYHEPRIEVWARDGSRTLLKTDDMDEAYGFAEGCFCMSSRPDDANAPNDAGSSSDTAPEYQTSMSAVGWRWDADRDGYVCGGKPYRITKVRVGWVARHLEDDTAALDACGKAHIRDNPLLLVGDLMRLSADDAEKRDDALPAEIKEQDAQMKLRGWILSATHGYERPDNPFHIYHRSVGWAALNKKLNYTVSESYNCPITHDTPMEMADWLRDKTQSGQLDDFLQR